MISEFSLFVFTTLGGVGAGMYAASAVFPVKGKRDNMLASAIPLVLLIIGCIALLMHLGHPERMFNAFANPTAGITLEAFATCAFGIILVIDLILSFVKEAAPRALRVAGAVVGVVLCVVMGIAYFTYESVAAWHSLATVPMFLFGSLAAGALLLSALSEASRAAKGSTATMTALAAIAAVAIAFDGAVFAGLGRSAMPFACAAVLAAAAAAAAFYAGKKNIAKAGWGAFALMFIAVIVARYAFYSVI